jgi:hypothetical protein
MVVTQSPYAPCGARILAPSLQTTAPKRKKKKVTARTALKRKALSVGPSKVPLLDLNHLSTKAPSTSTTSTSSSDDSDEPLKFEEALSEEEGPNAPPPQPQQAPPQLQPVPPPPPQSVQVPPAELVWEFTTNTAHNGLIYFTLIASGNTISNWDAIARLQCFLASNAKFTKEEILKKGWSPVTLPSMIHST